jgi:cyclopropane fatty-acyl-phospholipid synthase-like methyltransferase
MTNGISQESLLYGPLTAHIRRLLEPVAHDSFLFFEDTIGLLFNEIHPGMKVFDAGCGRGTITSWLAEKQCEIIAVDSSQERVDQTRQLLNEKQINGNVRLEVSQLPDSFPEDHFDLILDIFSWWHISDWGRLFNLSRKNLKPQGKLIILDTFLGWKTSLEFRQQMRELWHAAMPTLNECKNMLIKREFRLLRADSIQEPYTRYLDSVCEKIHELEKEDLGDADPLELQRIKTMWEWFRSAAHQEEMVATCIIAELTQY